MSIYAYIYMYLYIHQYIDVNILIAHTINSLQQKIRLQRCSCSCRKSWHYNIIVYSLYMIFIEEIWEHVWVHWQQDKCQSWPTYFMSLDKFQTANTRIWETDTNTGPCPIHKNGLAPAEWNHTLFTLMWQFRAGTFLHWAAYAGYWRIGIILYDKIIIIKCSSVFKLLDLFCNCHTHLCL